MGLDASGDQGGAGVRIVCEIPVSLQGKNRESRSQIFANRHHVSESQQITNPTRPNRPTSTQPFPHIPPPNQPTTSVPTTTPHRASIPITRQPTRPLPRPRSRRHHPHRPYLPQPQPQLLTGIPIPTPNRPTLNTRRHLLHDLGQNRMRGECERDSVEDGRGGGRGS